MPPRFLLLKLCYWNSFLLSFNLNLLFFFFLNFGRVVPVCGALAAGLLRQRGHLPILPICLQVLRGGLLQFGHFPTCLNCLQVGV